MTFFSTKILSALDLPNEWYYNDVLSALIEEGRDIMNSLGIEKMQIKR